MSELIQIRTRGLVVKSVAPNSPGSRAGLQSGDVIRKVNGVSVNDVIDFQFQTSEERFEIEFVRQGEYRTAVCERGWGEKVGLDFSFELADQIHTCDNKCVFCFIHQMPKGMRKSLYLMDDDFRLSFLHGNYVTLTNMSEDEFARTKEQGLSPLYVSVHATDPRLRGYMLGRGAPEPILPRIRDLGASGISVHCQVVLCPGLNDGAAFDQTVADLADLHEERSGLSGGTLSVAVVPVGLTQFRHNLYPIRPVTPDYAREFLKTCERWRRSLKPDLGTGFVFPADEWFYYAGQEVPGRAWYEDFPQFEDGIGNMRLFLDQSKRALKSFSGAKAHRDLTLVTSPLPSRVIEWLADELRLRLKTEVLVRVVRNRFFGESITVAGLMTGQDVSRTLREEGAKGIVAIPDICLKDGTLFVDDYDIERVRTETGLDVRAVPTRAREFLKTWIPENVLAIS